MSVMSKSSRPHRALICPNSFHDTSVSLSALQRASNDYYDEPEHTAFTDTFSYDSPRFPTERGAPSQRLYYPSDNSLLPSSGSAPRVRASPDLNDTPASPHEDSDGTQASTVGPTRVAKSHSRRQPPGHIPRPRNAFILYRSWYVRQGFLSNVENDHREISRIVGKLWKKMSSEEQAPWKVLAEQEKTEHARMYPNYKYSPNSRRDAAAASPTNRNAPTRLSTARSRKPKSPEMLTKKRSDAIAGAFASGSRKLSLTVGVSKIDEQIKARGSEATSSPQALPLAYPKSPSPVEPERLSSPVYCGAPSIDLGSTANDLAEGSDVPGTLQAVNYEPFTDFSLAACSVISGEINPDSVHLLPPEMFYRSESFFKGALRPYFDVDAELSASTTCDDPIELDLRSDSNLEPQSSYTNVTPNHPMASEPELSPFDRIVLEGTLAGHPGATSFGTPVWDLPPTSSSPINASSSLTSESFSNFYWNHPRSVNEDEYSTSSRTGDPQSRDYGFFSEWCNADSPVSTDVSDVSLLTPTSIASGAPSPSLSLAYPSPTYPNKHSALLYSSWETGHEDMDAYERALGDIKAEMDIHKIF